MLEFGLAEWISIISTVATLLMAVATWKMAKVTQLTLEEQNKPYVIVYPQQQEKSPTIIEIVIENMGSSPAYDVKFITSDNLRSKAWGIDKSAGEAPKFTDGPFVDGVKYLPPNGKRILYWGQYGGISESLQGKPAQVVTLFTDSAKKNKYSTESIFDINDFLGVLANEPFEARQIAVLKSISEKIDKMIGLLDRKFRPQSHEITYMWAYIAWFLLKDSGFSKANIFRVGRDAGLTEEQIQNAENEASRILRHYCPEQFTEKDEKNIIW